MRSALRTPATWIALVALLVAMSGAAYAAIPSSGGVITACYAQSSGFYMLTYHAKGDTRIVDDSEACRGYETRITWKDGSAPPPAGGAAYSHSDIAGPLNPPTVPFPGGELVGGPSLTITAPSGGGLIEVFAQVDGKDCDNGVVGLVEAPNFLSDDHLGTKGFGPSSTYVTRGIPGASSNGARVGAPAITRVAAGPHTFKLSYWGTESSCTLANLSIYGKLLSVTP